MIYEDREYQVRSFSFFSSEDPYDMRFGHEICWSRIYEYPFALAQIAALGNRDARIHNASWGFTDIHLVFKTWLDINYAHTYHSDLRPSTLYNTAHWDITNAPAEALRDRFDVVLNISTLEEVAADHTQVLRHHLVQLRRGGRFICTFDHPGLQLEAIEDLLKEKVVTPARKLSPRNSRLEDRKLKLADDFAVGHLVIDCVA
jgi:hypothetical protein